jgi:hypothetical protein
MKGHFRKLSQINTLPVFVELNIDILSQMELSFIIKKMDVFVPGALPHTTHKNQL